MVSLPSTKPKSPLIFIIIAIVGVFLGLFIILLVFSSLFFPSIKISKISSTVDGLNNSIHVRLVALIHNPTSSAQPISYWSTVYNKDKKIKVHGYRRTSSSDNDSSPIKKKKDKDDNNELDQTFPVKLILLPRDDEEVYINHHIILPANDIFWKQCRIKKHVTLLVSVTLKSNGNRKVVKKVKHKLDCDDFIGNKRESHLQPWHKDKKDYYYHHSKGPKHSTLAEIQDSQLESHHHGQDHANINLGEHHYRQEHIDDNQLEGHPYKQNRADINLGNRLYKQDHAGNLKLKGIVNYSNEREGRLQFDTEEPTSIKDQRYNDQRSKYNRDDKQRIRPTPTIYSLHRDERYVNEQLLPVDDNNTYLLHGNNQMQYRSNVPITIDDRHMEESPDRASYYNQRISPIKDYTHDNQRISFEDGHHRYDESMPIRPRNQRPLTPISKDDRYVDERTKYYPTTNPLIANSRQIPIVDNSR